MAGRAFVRNSGAPLVKIPPVPTPGFGTQTKAWLVFVGQSNGHGTKVSAVFTNAAIAANTTCTYKTVVVVAWDAVSQAIDASLPGPAPHFAAYWLAQGDNSYAAVHAIVAANNSTFINDISLNQLEEVFADLRTQGYDPDTDRVDFFGFSSENEANLSLGSVAAATAVEDEMVRWATVVRAELPLARCHFIELRATGGTYPHDAEANASIVRGVGRIGGSSNPKTRTPTLVDLSDLVHLEPDGANGLDLLAARAYAAAALV